MNNEVKEENVKNELVVKGFDGLVSQSQTKMNVFTNIEDTKKIYNLENHVDYKINDIKGESLRVKEVLIKVIEKPLEEPEINEETGEVIRDKEFKKICILIDTEDKSYVTASKTFTNQMARYIMQFGLEEPIDIKIIEKQVKNSSNKALGFELV